MAQPGGVVIVSGPIGEHRITIMLARGDLDLESDIVSDTAALATLVARLLDATLEVRRTRNANSRRRCHCTTAAVIDRINATRAGLVLIKTQFGGTRTVDMQIGDPHPVFAGDTAAQHRSSPRQERDKSSAFTRSNATWPRLRRPRSESGAAMALCQRHSIFATLFPVLVDGNRLC